MFFSTIQFTEMFSFLWIPTEVPDFSTTNLVFRYFTMPLGLWLYTFPLHEILSSFKLRILLQSLNQLITLTPEPRGVVSFSPLSLQGQSSEALWYPRRSIYNRHFMRFRWIIWGRDDCEWPHYWECIRCISPFYFAALPSALTRVPIQSSRFCFL